MANQITPNAAYVNCEQVMNRARAFVNDAFRGGKGRILTDTAPFTLEYLNAAIQELTDKISNNGVITIIRDNTILTPITPVAAIDPSVQVFISYQGYFDGTTMHAIPVLPSSCQAIYKLWERQTGSNLPFQEMTQPQEGLPSAAQGNFFRMWEYRANSIYLIGSLVSMDIRMRWETTEPVIVDADDLANTQIDILSSVNALATLVAYNYARARGAVAATQMQADAEKQMRYIVRRYTRRAQSVPYHRKPYGGEAGTVGNSVYSGINEL